ncbi:hypothetical protein [Clostridium sp.]|uniref:hypothetical protein n=1 Tax=Clostridium sp. TaxID=1506 RepID=UPI0032164314
MKHLRQRNIKILGELTSYLVRIGCSDLHIDFNTKGDITYISFISVNPDISEHTLNELTSQLNMPRRQDIEEYYWALNGDNDSSSELSLVGMMTDSVDVNYTNDVLKISLTRLK